MEAESVSMTTETGELVQSDVASSSNDVDTGLSQSAAESDALIAVSYDSAAPESTHHAVLPSLIRDGVDAESPQQPPGDGSTSTATAATSPSCSVQPEASLDWSTQWSGTDTVETVGVSQPVSTVLIEDDSPAAMKTTTTMNEQQSDNETCPAAYITPSSHLHHQDPQQQQPGQQINEDERVRDFQAGITCTDVPTAIDVLNTRYRLADVTIHRNMITWSSWNIADIVRGPHRESFWWRGRRTQRMPVQQQNGSHDNNEYQDEDERLNQQYVEEVCSKIERREREIALMLDKMDRDVTDDVIMTATVQQQQQQHACSPPQQPTQTNKRGNVFQRLLRALRKRFTRRRQQQQQQTDTTTTGCFIA